MQGREIRPPRLAATLLRLLLPSGPIGDSIRGDFWEEQRNRALSGSRLGARAWYWRHVLGLGARSLGRRIAPSRPVTEQPVRRGLGVFWDNLTQDVRFATRQITARPAFTLLVVLTLAVAIGPNVAEFLEGWGEA